MVLKTLGAVEVWIVGKSISGFIAIAGRLPLPVRRFKPLARKISVALAICCSVTSAASAQSADRVLTLGSKVEWDPYHIDTGSGADGLAVRALACIMTRMNQPFVIRKLPWSRAQLMTRNGQLDGFFSASQNKERDAYATQSLTFLPQTRRLYVLKPKDQTVTARLTLADAQKNLTVAARHQSNALKAAREAGLNVILTPQSAGELMELLKAGRVDGVVENDLVFAREIEAAGLSSEKTINLILGKKDMGVYFGHRFLAEHPRFLTQFNTHVPACSLLPATHASNQK